MSDDGIVALYARTSTDDQEDGIDSQLDSCRNKVEPDELNNVEIYKDEAVSGAKDDREDFNRLQTDIANGDVKTVIVSELSRLSRNTLTLMEFLEEVFEDEVGLRVADGQFPSMESGNPFMKALGRMMAVLAELERDLIAARTERGIKRAIDQGKWIGRPPKGFTTDDDGYLVVNTEEYLTVVEALNLVEKGASIYKVSRAIGIAEQTLSDIYNDDEKRTLYTRQDVDDDQVQEALDRAGGEIRGESDISKLWEEVGEMREMLEEVIEYDDEDVDQHQ